MIQAHLVEIIPVPKPRMSRSDAWKERDCVSRYWDYKDELKRLMAGVEIPPAYHLVFFMPMPNSWSGKKKKSTNGQPHLPKPDKDNLEKGWLDALFGKGSERGDDAAVWDGRVTKFWGYTGRILLLPIAPCNSQTLLELAGFDVREAA